MAAQSNPILTLSVLSAGAILSNRFVNTQRAQATAGQNTYGVSQMATTAAGQQLPVVTLGTAIVEAGAAMAAGASIESDAQGRAITRTSGVIAARLAPGQVASAAGDKVEVILIAN